MTKAIIYQPSKTAMQSGRAKTHYWLLEYTPSTKMTPDPLMGWNSGDTLNQVRLRFDTQEQAEDFAKQKGLDYVVRAPKPRKFEPKSYAANFNFNRRVSTTFNENP
ncbi:MAG: oxidoreductase [Rickettsiales bacterium]|nr:oxidoreductase [Rickettsiales bacterium]